MNTHIVPTIERAESGSLVVTSETIARGAAVEHRAVLQMIAKHEARIERFGTLAFEMRKSGGAPTRVALLNEQQSTLIMSFMRNTDQVMDFKEALVDGFFKMAEQIKNAPALTDEQIVAQALQITTAKVLALESKIEADAPKVEYVNNNVADNDTHLFRSVASTLMVGEMELRWALVYSGWIYHDQQRRRNSKNEYVTEHLWSEYADKKPYFYRQMNHQAALFKGNVFYQLKITTPGVPAISRLVTKILADHGTLKAALPVLEQRYNERKAS